MDISNLTDSSLVLRDEINTTFRRQLEHEEVLRLIECGIKFFLFQRGQIPLPYDRLLSSAGKCETGQNEIRSPSSSVASTLDDMDTCEESTVQRIRKLRAQRKDMHNKMLIAKRYNRLQNMEFKAHTVLEDLFFRLRSIFLSPLCNQINAVVILLGPSIFNHKEMITFEIDPALKKVSDNASNTIPSADNKSLDFNSITRSFCKSIVMSPEYLDFTEKSLRCTFSHICVVSDNELPIDLKTELIHIENYGAILSKNVPSHAKKNKKSLRVNLKLGNSGDDTIEDSMYLEDDNAHENCSNKESYFYQIPLRFKGVFVKSGPA